MFSTWIHERKGKSRYPFSHSATLDCVMSVILNKKNPTRYFSFQSNLNASKWKCCCCCCCSFFVFFSNQLKRLLFLSRIVVSVFLYSYKILFFFVYSRRRPTCILFGVTFGGHHLLALTYQIVNFFSKSFWVIRPPSSKSTYRNLKGKIRHTHSPPPRMPRVDSKN